jgi:LEA14-like dessication related protein
MRLLSALCLPLLCLLMLSCSQPKSLVYQDVGNFRVQNVNLQQATVVADVRFYNPNNYGLSLRNGDLDAYFNDRFLGKAAVDEQTAIPPRDTFVLPVSVRVDLKNIFPNALQLLTSQEVLVRLQGTVRVGKGGVFIGVPVRYEGRQKLKL